MAKISERIELEASTWERVDKEARRSGLTRNQVVDQAVRRALAGRTLDAILERVRDNSDLTPDEAAEIAANETAAFRAERAQTQATVRRK